MTDSHEFNNFHAGNHAVFIFFHVQSDDDINTTTSDIDSQPATPLSQASDTCEEPSHTIYTNDGLFKIPRARNDSATSQTEQDYIIAQRTRSKINLVATPIEAIESTFNAPDAPLDMYHDEQDETDPNWKSFLSNFLCPMSRFFYLQIAMMQCFTNSPVYSSIRNGEGRRRWPRLLPGCGGQSARWEFKPLTRSDW